MENTTKHPGGRPRKYAEGPGRYSITLAPADKDLVEKFLLWVQFHLGKRMGVAEVLLEGVRGSPLFAEFIRVTGYTPGRPAAEPVSLPLFTEPEPAGVVEKLVSENPELFEHVKVYRVGIPKAPEPVKAAPVESKPEALPVPVVTLQAPLVKEDTPPKAVPNAEGIPDESAVLALVNAAAKTSGKGVKGIAQGAGVDLTALYRALKGKQRLTVENRKKLSEYLKGPK